MSDDLKAKLGYMVPAHVEVQSGAGTNAPAAVFADYDYDVEDGNCGLHQSAKQACEPAIVYVRADALDARDAEIARLREALVQIDALDPGENVRYMASAALAGNITNIGHIARAALIRQAEEQGND